MSFKQIGKNLFDHFYPIFIYKKKLQYLKDEFKDFIFHDEHKEQSELEMVLLKNEQENQTMIRRYQSLRDGKLSTGKGGVLDNYMQLIV